MSKQDVVELWLSLYVKFHGEGNVRWANYCEEQLQNLK